MINEMAIYPTEEVMWDEDVIPSEDYEGQHCLALPKLNLQFLTFYDYLLRYKKIFFFCLFKFFFFNDRNYDLYRLESAYSIREDIADAIKR